MISIGYEMIIDDKITHIPIVYDFMACYIGNYRKFMFFSDISPMMIRKPNRLRTAD